MRPGNDLVISIIAIGLDPVATGPVTDSMTSRANQAINGKGIAVEKKDTHDRNQS